jgi:23S rRNA (pseudouridine1915-N3)-methyltransferase
MIVRHVAVGTRMPGWVTEGFADYAQRLPRELKLEVVEIPLAVRGKNPDVARAKQAEGEKLLERSRATTRIVLDERGDAWSSAELARQLERWKQAGRDVSLLVGGPDGHAPAVLGAAEKKWSLSKLTLPHALVRVLVAEQIYRAWSLLANHPYHRA